MPLYEIVLRFRDRDEIRITDRNGYRIGEEVVVARRRFRVLGTEPTSALNTDNRFVLEPCDDRSGPEQAPP